MNQSTKTKSQQVSLMSGNKNINLPKLDRIIIKNNPSYKNPIYQPPTRIEKKPTNINDILKIEGKNGIKYNQPNRGIEKDIKA